MMIIRQVEKEEWKDLEKHIKIVGRTKPLSPQLELDINYKGTDYTLLVQLEKDCKIAVLQALKEYVEIDDDGDINKNYSLEEDERILLQLLDQIINQKEVKKELDNKQKSKCSYSEKEQRELEIKEIVKWMTDSPVVIEKMLNRRGSISLEECIQIIEILEKKELEYLIPIFIYTIRMYYVVDDAIHKMMNDNLIGTWQENNTKEFFRELKNKFKEEIIFKNYTETK